MDDDQPTVEDVEPIKVVSEGISRQNLLIIFFSPEMITVAKIKLIFFLQRS